MRTYNLGLIEEIEKKVEIDYNHTNKKTRDQNEQVGKVWKSKPVNYEFNTLIEKNN